MLFVILIALSFVIYKALKNMAFIDRNPTRSSIRIANLEIPGYKVPDLKLKKFDLPILYLGALLGLSFWYLFKPLELGLQAVIFSSLLYGSTVLLMKRYKKPVSRTSCRLMGLGLLFSALLAVHRSEMLVTFNVLMVLWLNTLLVLSLTEFDLKKSTLVGYLVSPFAALQYLALGISGARQAQNNIPESSPTEPPFRISRDVINGIGIGLVLLIGFGSLLISADQTVASYFDFDGFSISLNASMLYAAFWTITGSLFMGSIWHYLLRMSPENYVQTHHRSKQSLSAKTTQIALMFVVALFGLFALLQISVIAGLSANSTDLRLAENAREGFGQLIVAAGLVLGTLSLFMSSTKGFLGDKRNRLLSVTWVLLTLVVLASAYRRLYDYEAAYGFTVSRLLAHSIILLLAVWLLGFAFKIARMKTDAWYAGLAFIAIIVWLLGLNAINPDKFIAKTNIERANTRQVDAAYLSTLSIDASTELAAYASEPMACNYVYDSISNTVDQDWRTWNLSAQRHNNLVTDKATIFLRSSCILD